LRRCRRCLSPGPIGVISRRECIDINQAKEKIGETACVTGTVQKVYQTSGGAHLLEFCADYRSCPFTVVVFANDLRHVGDVRMLTGKTIEIHGPIREYNGHAEIILRHDGQLRGEAARLPAVPSTYDVERPGRHSAGKFKSAKESKKSAYRRRKSSTWESPPETAPPEISEPKDPR